MDTTKNKNDLLTYDSCLEKESIFKGIEKTEDIIFNSNLVYTVSIVDQTYKNFSELKKSTRIENYFYSFGSCLPQGFKDRNNITTTICKENDYSLLNKLLLDLLTYTNDTQYDTFFLGNTKNDNEIFLKLIPLYILNIPFILFK